MFYLQIFRLQFSFYCTFQTQPFLVSHACLFKDTLFCTKTNIYNGKLRRTVRFHFLLRTMSTKICVWEDENKNAYAREQSTYSVYCSRQKWKWEQPAQEPHIWNDSNKMCSESAKRVSAWTESQRKDQYPP